MERDRHPATGLLALVAALLTGAVALVAPLLDPSVTASGAALALALALLTALTMRSPLRVARPCAVTAQTSFDDGAALPGRVGDAVRHPRRPRAPGAR